MKKEFTVNGVPFTMVFVEGGTFKLCNQFKVTLPDYYIGETLVTQELWKAVMDHNPSYYKGNEKRPVENISPEACKKFVRKLSKLTGEKFRIPSEAEWEFAVRSDNKLWTFREIRKIAWSILDNMKAPRTIKQKCPNVLGIYDLLGNVWEICLNYFNDDEEYIARGGSFLYKVDHTFYTKLFHRYEIYPRCSDITVGFRLALKNKVKKS